MSVDVTATLEASPPGTEITLAADGRASAGGLLRRAGILGIGLAGLRATIAGAAESRNGLSAALGSEREKMAHLLRRAGFGASSEELNFYTRLGIDGAIDYLVKYDQVNDDELENRLNGLGLKIEGTGALTGDMQRWWLLRMIYTRRPLLEKMTLFWHGLLVSERSKVSQNNYPNAMITQNRFFREKALAGFGGIMKGISRDPAMVFYLDSNTNVRGRPNENYARELMELFMLGIYGPTGQPNYTEQDVREAARAFTGWGLTPATNPPTERQFRYQQSQHDHEPKTIFGQTFNFDSEQDGDYVVELILAHPSCAYYISKRLFEFFVYDAPDAATLQPIVDEFRATNGSVERVLRGIFRSPAFFSERAYRAKVKAPAEFVAGLSRALELETDAAGGGSPSFSFLTSMPRMGQTLFDPPDVSGWSGGVDWFTTTTWLERINVVNYILRPPDVRTKPVNFASFIQRFGLTTPERATDFFLGLLVDGQVTDSQRQILLKYVRQSVTWPGADQSLDPADPVVDRKMRGLVYLIASMPEFQLA